MLSYRYTLKRPVWPLIHPTQREPWLKTTGQRQMISPSYWSASVPRGTIIISDMAFSSSTCAGVHVCYGSKPSTRRSWPSVVCRPPPSPTLQLSAVLLPTCWLHGRIWRILCVISWNGLGAWAIIRALNTSLSSQVKCLRGKRCVVAAWHLLWRPCGKWQVVGTECVFSPH